MQKSTYEEFLEWKENLISENKESFLEFINNSYIENSIKIPLPYFHVVPNYLLEDIKYLREIEFKIARENWKCPDMGIWTEEQIINNIKTYHYTSFSKLTDGQIETLYREWSQDTHCAGWLSMSEISARDFIKWATTTPCERVRG